ncbi:MAG TPA: hypothetical protein IAC36_09725 [Candidatus Aphodomonas merdavium]|nr:hypothetical protein [Candidatus Aphodomonas merdavium]
MVIVAGRQSRFFFPVYGILPCRRMKMDEKKIPLSFFNADRPAFCGAIQAKDGMLGRIKNFHRDGSFGQLRIENDLVCFVLLSFDPSYRFAVARGKPCAGPSQRLNIEDCAFALSGEKAVLV